MMTTKAQISEWFDEGVRRKATHLIVVCDTFDHEDYPVYVAQKDDAKEIAEKRYGYPDEKNMQRVMEVYDLRLNKSVQMAKGRVFNF